MQPGQRSVTFEQLRAWSRHGAQRAAFMGKHRNTS